MYSVIMHMHMLFHAKLDVTHGVVHENKLILYHHKTQSIKVAQKVLQYLLCVNTNQA